MNRGLGRAGELKFAKTFYEEQNEVDNTSQVTALPTQAEPRPFHEIPPLWLRLPEMNESFFSEEVPHSNDLSTFLGVAVYACLATACVVFTTLLRSLFLPNQGPSIIGVAVLTGACITLIGSPIAFYLNTGINYLSAMVFGGKGTFGAQAYLHSIYFVPLGVIAALGTVLEVIPGLGVVLALIISLVVFAFGLLFDIRAFKVVHGFTGGRATAAVLTPTLVLLIFVCLPIAVIGGLMVMGPMIGNTFSSINQSLLTPTP